MKPQIKLTAIAFIVTFRLYLRDLRVNPRRFCFHMCAILHLTTE